MTSTYVRLARKSTPIATVGPEPGIDWAAGDGIRRPAAAS